MSKFNFEKPKLTTAQVQDRLVSACMLAESLVRENAIERAKYESTINDLTKQLSAITRERDELAEAIRLASVAVMEIEK